ncbi:MAG: LysR family transcriptional regulator [Bacteroidetes bacterium]|nr:LysR family transcriptional regulator [Bacteroidota bacterium]
MNLNQLKYVMAVHEHRHFGKAAVHCDVTQATLSAMIKKLEEELGLVLFDRDKQPTVITEAGLQVVKIAKDMLSKQQELLDLSKNTSTSLKGTFKLGIIPTVANSLLPLILPSLLEQHPELELTIAEITTEEIIHRLKEDRIDVGILATPLEEEELEENILYYETMMVYGVSDPKKKFIAPKDVQDEKVWLLEEGNCFRNQSMTICDIQEKSNYPNKLHFEGSSFDTLLNLSDHFGGITLVPELYHNLMSESKQKRTRMFKAPYPVREISAVYYRPFAKKNSIDLLSEHIKKLITPRLISTTLPKKDLSIIGI